MSNKFHKDLSLGDIHVIQNFEYPDQATMFAATGFTNADIGKVARTVTEGSFFVLTSVSPIQWTSTVSSGNITFVTDSSTSGVSLVDSDQSGILILRPIESSSGTVQVSYNSLHKTIDINLPANLVGVASEADLIASGQVLLNLHNLDAAAINTLSGTVLLNGIAIATLSGRVGINAALSATAISSLSGTVSLNTIAINALSGTVGLHTAAIASLSGQVGLINTEISTISGSTSLNTIAINTLSGQVSLNTTAINIISGTLASPSGVVFVSKNTIPGHFTSIKTAVDSITTATSGSPFLVSVAPGAYIEDPITMKEFVRVLGGGSEETIVIASQTSGTIFQLVKNSSIDEMFLTGSTASGAAAVFYDDPTSVAGDTASIENIRFGANYTHIKMHSSGNRQLLTSTNVKFAGNYPFTRAFSITGDSARLQLRNSTTLGNMILPISEIVYVSGSNCQIVANGAQWRTGVIGGAGDGVRIEDGSSMRLTSCNINGFNRAIYMPNIGGATAIAAVGINFENNNIDIEADHPSANGHIVGLPEYLKTIINPLNQVFVAGKDQRIVTVATKGGDFASVSDACASITDASAQNEYVVLVGPGVFVEPLIYVQPFVSLVGSDINTTIIRPDASDHHIIDLDVSGEVAFMTLQGSGPGFAAIYSNDRGDFTQAHKVSIYDCDIGVWHRAINNESTCYLEYVDINTTFSKAIFVESISGQTAFLNTENFYTFPTGQMSGVIGVFATGTGAEVDMQAFGVNGNNIVTVDESGFIGLSLSDGAAGFVQGGYFRDCAVGMEIASGDPGGSLDANGVVFNNCTVELNILSDTAAGSFTGYARHNRTFINPNSSFFITNKDAKIFTVAQKGGDFASIADAINSITDSSVTNRYLISVGPGVFTEPVVDLRGKPFVSVQGASDTTTIIEPDGDHHIIDLGIYNEVSSLTVRNSTSGFAGIRMEDQGAMQVSLGKDSPFISTEQFSKIHRINIEDCDIGMFIRTTSGSIDTMFYGEFVTVAGAFTHAAKLICEPSGYCACAFLVHYTILPTLVTPTVDNYISGVGAAFELHAGMLNGVSQTSTAFQAAGGAFLNVSASTIDYYGTGIEIVNDGAATDVIANNIVFTDTTQQLNVLSSGAVGYLTGFVEYERLYINPLSSFFITGTDLQNVTVSKRGGNFDSIATAIGAITDASFLKPYVVSVGPGVFHEPTITMKQFVNVKGVGDNQSTVIMAASPTQKTIIGADNSSITNVTLAGANASGGIALYHEGAGTFTPFQVKNVVFASNYTQVQAFGNSGATILLLEACLIGGTSNQTNIIQASANSGVPCQVALVDVIYQDVIPPFTTGDFINATGPTTELVIENVLARVGSPTGNGLVIQDGVQCRISGLSLRGFKKGIWIQNVGAASFLKTLATALEGNTTDFQNDHPGLLGSFFGSATESKIFNANPDYPILVQDISSGNLLVTGTMKLGIQGHGFQDISTLVIESSSMGANEGGELSMGSGLVLNVADGFGYVEVEPELLIKIEWGSQTITLPASQSSYVYFNENSILTADAGFPDTRRVILLGRVVTNSGAIDFIDATATLSEHVSNLYDNFFRVTMGPLFGTGCTVTSNSSGNISVSQGEYFYSANQFNTSGMVNGPFQTIYNISGAIVTTDNVTVVDSSNYNDTTSGLVPLPAGFFARHALYTVGQDVNEKYFVVYGQAQYSGLATAQVASNPTPPSYFIDGVTSIATLIVQQGSGIVQILDARPTIGSKAGTAESVTVHAQLLGLGADDHKQYLLANGTRAMAGNLDMGGNSIVNVNLVQGVVVSGHASRHLPNGADPITTAAPTTSLNGNSTNSVGIQNSLARSDHGHAIDNATQSIAGLMSAGDKTKLDGIPSTISGDLFTSGQIIQQQIANNRVQVTAALVTLSGNLIASGQTLLSIDSLLNTADQTLSGIVLANQVLDVAAITTLSGNLFASGQTLLLADNLLNTAVGTLSGIVLTNQSLDTTAITTLSGNLFTSGQTLLVADNLLNVADQTLSGNLFASGQILSQVATHTANGLMSASDKTKLDGIGGATIIKAGFLSGSVFAGSPKTAQVTFGLPFNNTNYAISITPGFSRTFSYQSKTISGFVMNSNANGAFTQEVSWMAISNGESVE